MKLTHVALAGLLSSLTFVAAEAATLDLLPGGRTGAQATDTAITINVPTGLGAGTLSFEIAGYLSLDGVNQYEDVFSLKDGGTELFSGSFNMGGGGYNAVLFNPYGAAVQTTTFGDSAHPHNSTAITWRGGVTDVSIPMIGLPSRPLVFSYTSLSGPHHAGFQGLSDEGWGLNSVSFTQAVPEPQSYALLLGGLAAIGFVARRRKI